MHLSRNFAWSLDLSDREFKVIVKLLKDEDLTDEETSLANKLSDTITMMAVRLERISSGRAYKGPRPAHGSHQGPPQGD
jgi:hypothetical protein